MHEKASLKKVNFSLKSLLIYRGFFSNFSKSSGKNEKKVDKQDFSCYEHNA